MDYPTVVDQYLTNFSVAYGSQRLLLPDTLQIGDLVLNFFGHTGTVLETESDIGGWLRDSKTTGGTAHRGVMAYTWVDENWASHRRLLINLIESSATFKAHVATIIVRGASHLDITSTAYAANTQYTFPAITPANALQNYRYIGAVSARLGAAATISADPLGYTAVSSAANTDAGFIGVCHRSSTDNPAVSAYWASSLSREHVGWACAAYGFTSASGVVRDDDDAVAERTVRMMDRDTGRVLHETTSSALDGTYLVMGRDGVTSAQVIFIGDDVAEGATYHDLLRRVTPG